MWLFVAGSAQAQFFPQTVRVPTDDPNVTLATDVWRNFLDGTPRPVLLRRTPYGRALDATTAANLMNAGFIVVSQDVRGRGDSTGTFEPFFTDKQDGRATIDWIAAQPWSSGRVATYSASAEGIVQYMAMAAAPDALACSHVVFATHDVYASIFPGGAWRTELDNAWLDQLGADDVVTKWKAHEARDGYWDAATLSVAEMAKIDHPVFVYGGFFDVFSRDEHDTAVSLAQNVAPSSRGDFYFVLGPWTHGTFGSALQGQLSFPDDAKMTSYVTELVQYLKWCLLGASRPPFANVRYWVTEISDDTVVDSSDNVSRVVAKGEWHDDSVWPPKGSRGYSVFLRDAHELGARAEATPVALPIDPAHPTPSVGGGNLTTAAGPFDQTEVDARPDVYTATTAPFTEPTTLVGAPHALIWASSATDDVDVVVRLEVVTPGGKAIGFTDGIRRGRFVNGFDAIRALTPNVPAAFDVALGPIALRLPAGFALRIAISGSSSPRYEPNPNTSAALASHPTAQATTLTLYSDAQHPSRIDLPVLSGSVPNSVLAPIEAPVATMDGGVAVVRDASVRSDAGPQTETGMHDATGVDAGTLDGGPDVDGEVGHDDGCSCDVAKRTAQATLVDALSVCIGALWLLRRRKRLVA